LVARHLDRGVRLSKGRTRLRRDGVEVSYATLRRWAMALATSRATRRRCRWSKASRARRSSSPRESFQVRVRHNLTAAWSLLDESARARAAALLPPQIDLPWPPPGPRAARPPRQLNPSQRLSRLGGLRRAALAHRRRGRLTRR
jgi:hypothetical protein